MTGLQIASPGHAQRSGLAVQTKAGFGIGQIAGQLFRDAPSLLLLFYLTSILGIEPALAGAVIFIPKVLFGAGFDLTVGLVSDRYAARFARRRWLLVGAIAAPFAMLGAFTVPEGSQFLQLAWVFISFSFYMAVFSTFSVPYLAQFAEMTDSPAERTELMAWKHGFTGVGVLLGSAGTPVMIHILGGGRTAYIWSIGVIGLICSAALLIAWYSAGKIPDRKNTARPLEPRELLKVFSDRRFVILCLSAVIMTVAAGISYASFAFFVSFAMGRSDAFVQIGIISTIMAFVVMAGAPTWVYVAKWLGKKRTYIVAATCHGLVLICWGTYADSPIYFAYIMAGLLALFNSGWGLIILSMLSDAIARSREERGENRAGAYSAVWSIIEKAGIAAGGTLVVGGILSLTGFDTESAKQGIAQSADAIQGIVLAYAFIPGIAKIVTAGLIWIFMPDDDLMKPAPVEFVDED
ncbi:MFS transporter [Sphingorhabdus sp. SMR4y]|uniref:MFS transporter n=1 Tax=Sphingorhabdus sp. SMR4y TaxID=2584094 RepID=UPI000B5C1D69|nr:MFS transporter [Sphingorhabdus sp. SMR4y]ASK89325.1 putative 2,3-dihydroxypropane-1-sulfonate exporter [Sphingorhabdus sp. SMR4y]